MVWQSNAFKCTHRGRDMMSGAQIADAYSSNQEDSCRGINPASIVAGRGGLRQTCMLGYSIKVFFTIAFGNGGRILFLNVSCLLQCSLEVLHIAFRTGIRCCRAHHSVILLLFSLCSFHCSRSVFWADAICLLTVRGWISITHATSSCTCPL